ncbi:MAG: GIY-YIG nuclease family protein [Bacteroidaceae bacterium]|nr:GIY-YIG nuclease family protein [Bacteroidaceae bacterium]
MVSDSNGKCLFLISFGQHKHIVLNGCRDFCDGRPKCRQHLDPQERIDELSDASVPFNFDIHAMIFSDNAPALEAALHKAFEKALHYVRLRRCLSVSFFCPSYLRCRGCGVRAIQHLL